MVFEVKVGQKRRIKAYINLYNKLPNQKNVQFFI